MGAVVGLAARQRIDRQLQRSFDQPLAQRQRIGIAQMQLDAGMAGLDRSDQLNDLVGCHRAHDADAQRRAFHRTVALRQPLGGERRLVDFGEVRLQHAPELGQVRVLPLAVEQHPAELAFEQLDGPRQRRLRHVAGLGRAREVELLAQSQKVADLVHFHRRSPRRRSMAGMR